MDKEVDTQACFFDNDPKRVWVVYKVINDGDTVVVAVCRRYELANALVKRIEKIPNVKFSFTKTSKWYDYMSSVQDFPTDM